MQTRKLFYFAPIILIALFASGCSIKFNTGKNTDNSLGGVFRSVNKGEVWQNKSLIPTVTGKPESIAGLDAFALENDPGDLATWYFGSTANGLFYSNDRAESWLYVSSLGAIPITDVAIDSKDKCNIYASSANKLHKSIDCTRTWKPTYVHDDPRTIVTEVEVDSYNPEIIYVGTSRGEVLKSTDSGENWQLLNNFADKVEELLLSPNDTRVILVGTTKKGIFRSRDGGSNWTDLKEAFKEIRDYRDFRDMEMPSGQGELVFYATQNNIYKSSDLGDTWTELKLITPERGSSIYAIAVNPADINEIYYVTTTTFYASADGGEKWSTKKLPTSRAGYILKIDPEDQRILYMTTMTVK